MLFHKGEANNVYYSRRPRAYTGRINRLNENVTRKVPKT